MGPRFGKDMPLAAKAVEALDPGHVAEALRSGQPVHVNVAGREHPLEADDLAVAMKPLDGYQLEREGSHAVALELEIDEELELEGLAREVVHSVQAARRDAGFEVEDRIRLSLGGDPKVIEAANIHRDYIAGEVLAEAFEASDSLQGGKPVQIDGLDLLIGVERV